MGPRQMNPRLLGGVVAGAFLLPPITTGALEAQDTPAVADTGTVVTLIGEVRDALTEQPIRNAAVKVLELERVAWTDPNGFFRFEGLPVGTWTFETTALAYGINSEASTIAENNILLIRLEPRPVELEGLYVEARSFLKERRMRTPVRVLAWDRAELEESVSPDVGQMLKRRGVAHFVPCGDGDEFTDMDLPNCILRYGSPAPIRLFIDDIPVMPAIGASQLWAYDPRDLWSVEFIRVCNQIRIYTRVFMEQVEGGRVRLDPRLCG